MDGWGTRSLIEYLMVGHSCHTTCSCLRHTDLLEASWRERERTGCGLWFLTSTFSDQTSWFRSPEAPALGILGLLLWGMLLVIHKADVKIFFVKLLSRITELTSQKVLKQCYPNIVLCEGGEWVFTHFHEKLIDVEDHFGWFSIDLKPRTAKT